MREPKKRSLTKAEQLEKKREKRREEELEKERRAIEKNQEVGLRLKATLRGHVDEEAVVAQERELDAKGVRVAGERVSEAKEREEAAARAREAAARAYVQPNKIKKLATRPSWPF